MVGIHLIIYSSASWLSKFYINDVKSRKLFTVFSGKLVCYQNCTKLRLLLFNILDTNIDISI